MRDPAFFEQPLCAETDPDLFFPDIGVIPNKAKTICRQCDHIAECLIWSLHNVVDGVWAATTPKERQHLRKELGIIGKPFYKSGMFITPIERNELTDGF